jgi:peptide/nickel transport system permease protein
VLVIIITSIILFLLMRILPGDPILIYTGQSELNQMTPESIHDIRVKYGLDKPLPQQYIDWVYGLVHGDFGNSIFYNQKVSTLLKQSIPITIHLGVLALIISSILGVLAGLACALRRGGKVDIIVTSITNIGISIPIFWLGVLMVSIFSLKLGWLPVQGYTSPFEDFWLGTRQLIMPVICLSVVALAGVARQTRSSMIEIIRQDYIRTAWSKGLKEKTIVTQHILKNGLIPVITFIGVNTSHILGGAVLVETVFNVPGMGRLMVGAIFNQDFQVVQGGIVIIAIMVSLVNLVVDISYGWIDPRIRYN